MIKLKRMVVVTATSGALAVAAFGLGSGLANATPMAPLTPGSPVWQDDGWGWGPGHGHGHGHGGYGWGAPWYGPGYYGGGITACVSASGPWGYVTGSICI
jgi:hypothetical protein